MRVLQYPVTTEKAVGMIERENKIVFIVDTRADKKQIKEAVEKTYNVKVEKVNVLNAIDGRKKAFIKLAKGYSADDIAAKLKIA
jgi:ribosomal protein uL23